MVLRRKSTDQGKLSQKNKSPRAGGARSAVAEALETRQLLTVPAGFSETVVVDGLRNPTSMDLAPDGRIFVSEQPGTVRVVKNGTLLSTPFATVPTQRLGERGLSSVVLDPNFNQNGYVYCYWTVPENGSQEAYNKITRFTASGDVAVPGSDVTIFELDPIGTRINHMGGAMHFGIDGKLWITTGESNKPDYAQSLSLVMGKVLRINSDGSIPTDNPYYNETTGRNRAIWAMGLRNPFTFGIQPGTGRIFIDDVGNSAWEELNEGLPHHNYGWPLIEGPRVSQTPPADYKDPLYAYRHSPGCAITGGTFYNPANNDFPSDYVGDYFFGDLCSSMIRIYDPETQTVRDWATHIQRPVDLDVAGDGAMYILSNARDDDPIGKVTVIRHTESLAPTIGAQPASKTISVGKPVTFTVSASGDGLSYQWQRNGTNISGATGTSYTLNSVTLADNGATFRVKVTNSAGSATSDAATLTVTSDQPPAVTINFPAGTRYVAGQSFTIDGIANDPEQGVLGNAALTWRVDFHHDTHTHPFIQSTTGVGSIQFTIPTSGEISDNVWYRVHLDAQDDQGISAGAFVDIFPTKVFFTVNTNVAGLSFAIDGQPRTDLYTDHAVVGVERILSAPASQTLNGVTYDFVSWSDGGAAEHVIATPTADTQYVANYQARATTPPSTEPPPTEPPSTEPPPSEPPTPTGIDLMASLLSVPPANVIGGEKGKTKVRVANDGTVKSVGSVNVDLFLSADTQLDNNDTQVAGMTKRLSLKPGKGKSLSLTYQYPSLADGNYYVLARIVRPDDLIDDNSNNDVVASATPVTNHAPVIDFTATFTRVPAAIPRVRSSIGVSLFNSGNVVAKGPISLTLFAANDASGISSAGNLQVLTKSIKIAPGKAKNFSFKFTPPDELPAGTYYFAVSVDSAMGFAEASETNNIFVSQGTFVLG